MVAISHSMLSVCILGFISTSVISSELDADHAHFVSPGSPRRDLLQTAGTDCLAFGNTISSDDPVNYLVSETGIYWVRLEDTGELVVYEGGLNARDEVARLGTAGGTPPYTLSIRADHRLEVTDSTPTSIWIEGTADGGDPSNVKLVMQVDGNVVVEDRGVEPVAVRYNAETNRLDEISAVGTFDEAITACNPEGVYTIRNVNDLITLRATAEAQGQSGLIFVGIHDPDMDDMWSFQDGSCCVESTEDCENLPFWEDGEPAIAPNRDCAVADLDAVEGNLLILSAARCSVPQLYACNARDVMDASCSSDEPTSLPTQFPTVPTVTPTSAPTRPTMIPTSAPSQSPSTTPTDAPSSSPSANPSLAPSGSPSDSPSSSPSTTPSATPTQSPISCTQNELYPIFLFIFRSEEIACSVIFELLPPSILEALVERYRARICLALRTFNLTDEQLAEFLRLLQTTLDELDCDDDDDESSVSLGSIESAEGVST